VITKGHPKLTKMIQATCVDSRNWGISKSWC